MIHIFFKYVFLLLTKYVMLSEEYMAIFSTINGFLWKVLILLQYDISVKQNVHSDTYIWGFCKK